MKIAITHLTDIHFEDGRNPIADRAKKIKSAIQSLSAEIEVCIVPVTGDIAFSGKDAEYALAAGFFSDLLSQLRSMRPDMTVEFVFIPGNHDCDLSGDQEVRDDLVEHMPQKLATLDPTKGVVGECVKVQDAFFRFESGRVGTPELKGGDRLYYEREVVVGSKRLKFNCYNTAWLAQIKSEYKPLYFPVQIAAPRAEEKGAEHDIVFSLFHYPYNWLEPNNSLDFKKLIDRTSDVILSGHEHTPSGYLKQLTTGGETFYLEGAALQETGQTSSGFNVLLLDLGSDEIQVKVSHFSWDGSMYQPSGKDEWRPLKRNSLIQRRQIENNEEFERYLSEGDYAFTHRRKKEDLRLHDLFVYPDFLEEQLYLKVSGRSEPRLIEGEEILDYIIEHRHVLFFGAAETGKTTLTKVFYRDLKRRGLHPLLLKPSEVSSSGEQKFLRNIRRAFGAQYDSRLFENFKQLERDQRILIVDDFHAVQLNPAGREQFLDLASKWFAHILLVASDLFPVQILTSGGEETPIMREFRHCMVKPFGWRRRNHLIKKWLKLGREFTPDEEMEDERKLLVQTVDVVLDKNVFPSTPLVVLAILQTLEATRGHNTGAGAIGHIHEALITSAVHKISTKPTDVEKIYIFLSHIAYEMFVKERNELSVEEIFEVAKRYFKRFGVNYDVPKLLSDLERARIMRASGGEYRFEPRHFYYYFVARYFRDSLNDPAQSDNLRAAMREMVDTVHYEEYAHILDFITYLTKEPLLFERMLENAPKIYAEHAPCDLKSDVEFVNRMITDVPERELPPTTVEENREHHLTLRDKIEDETAVVRAGLKGEKVRYSNDLDDLIKLNISFKTMDLMGQVVRNFPYSLPAEMKESLVRECELLALRTLNAILSIAKDNLDACKVYYAQLIKERRALNSDHESKVEADMLLIWLTQAIGFGIIKKVSYAIGAQELMQTHQQVLKKLESLLGARLIDISIKLDHFSSPPVSDIEALSKGIKTNSYAYTLLRDLGLDYLYLYHVDQRLRQRLVEALELKITDKRLYDSPLKRLPLAASNK